jgi:hypothetical protein
MDGAAIQNLEFLRQLIAEARAEGGYEDMELLRMLQGTGMGTDALTAQQEDR